jgi:hypothetical protein
MKINKEKKFSCLDQGLDCQIVMLMNFETIYKYYFYS